jgi:TRPM family ion channel
MPTADGPRVKRLAHPDADIRARSLGVPRGRPVIALFSSGEPVETELGAKVLPLLRQVVAGRDAVFITAGADVGVVHLLGVALEAVDGKLPPFVAVAPSGKVVTGEETPTAGELPLNPNHDVAVLVPGKNWGEETPALFRTVDAITGKRGRVTALLIGGDNVARAQVTTHLSGDRPLVVVAGTGGLADEIAGGRLSEDDDLAVLVRSGTVVAVHLDEGAERVVAALDRTLGAKPVAKLTVWPRLRYRAPEPIPIIDPGFVVEYPLLADAIHEANRVIAPAFHECDEAAHRERNHARLLIVLAIAAGFGATAFGALQAWLGTQAWPGVLVAIAGALAAALVALSRRYEASEDDLSAAHRAESLRALYFDHLAAPLPATDADREARLRDLVTAVARHRHEPVTTS